MKYIRICNIPSLFQVFHLEIPVPQIRWPYKKYFRVLLSKAFIVSLIFDWNFHISLTGTFWYICNSHKNNLGQLRSVLSGLNFLNLTIPNFYRINSPKVSCLLENQTKLRIKLLNVCVCLYMWIWLDKYLQIHCDPNFSNCNKYLPGLKQDIQIHKPLIGFMSLLDEAVSLPLFHLLSK